METVEGDPEHEIRHSGIRAPRTPALACCCGLKSVYGDGCRRGLGKKALQARGLTVNPRRFGRLWPVLLRFEAPMVFFVLHHLARLTLVAEGDEPAI